MSETFNLPANKRKNSQKSKKQVSGKEDNGGKQGPATELQPLLKDLIGFKFDDNKMGFKIDETNKNMRFARNVNEGHVFYVCDGSKLKNLMELAIALRHMPDETFSYHVNEQKHDFANWIRDCMDEGELAQQLAKYTTKTSNELLVLRRIASEVHKLGQQ